MNRDDFLKMSDEEIMQTMEDAACFRFWVREAANSPGDMAKLIMRCITEQDYRDAILPIALAAQRAIDLFMKDKP